jgi:hypothetical protein
LTRLIPRERRQLFVFRRFGFATMYALRIAYYLCWRIVWGYARQPQ